MRLSTLGRLATGTAVLLFVTAAGTEAYGHAQLRLILLITAGSLITPVAVYLLFLQPAKPSRPTPTALTAPARPGLWPAVAEQPVAITAGPVHRVLPARRRPSPTPRADRAALTR